ncbi:hypothetical protein GCM10027020_06020 [Nocardioides salsibiostraticola]
MSDQSATSGDVHIAIDHLVLTGLSAAEAREVVGEMRTALAAALAPAGAATGPTPWSVAPARTRAGRLGQNAARHIAIAAGQS